MSINPISVEAMAQARLADLVLQRPGLARLLDSVGLDYCCGGNASLAAACELRGLDLDEVLELLKAEEDPASEESLPAAAASLSADELILLVMERYHLPLEKDMPQLAELLRHVEGHHGKTQTWLAPALSLFEQLCRDLDRHLRHEEQEVFPAVTALFAGRARADELMLLRFELEQLRSEHERSGRQLEQLRSLALGYQPPAGACRHMQQLMAELQRFEEQLHQHVFIENELLFGKVRERMAEQEILTQGA